MTSAALTPLACSNCGAALTAAPEGNLIRCEYCHAAHMFLAPPPPRTESTPAKHAVGDAVMVEWGSRWWKAHVVEAAAGGRWKIHYDGWGDKWDETVGEDRIHPAGSEASAPTGGRSVLYLSLSVVVGIAAIGVWAAHQPAPTSSFASSHPSRATPTGQPITSDTVLRLGERIEVRYGGSWYDAHVLAVQPDGAIRVHYEGWASTYDEVVSRDRVRVFGAHVVNAALAGTAALPGTALEPTATLQSGDPVWGLSQGQWWRAEVVRHQEDGRYEVRYIGYEQRWNESLALDQLRRRTD